MSDLTASSIKKLKVAELRAELAKRGEDTKGKKDELVTRLFSAVSSASSAPTAATNEGDVQMQQVESTPVQPATTVTPEESETAEVGEGEVSDSTTAADVEMANDEEKSEPAAAAVPESETKDVEAPTAGDVSQKEETPSTSTEHEKAEDATEKPVAEAETKPPAEPVDKLMEVEVEDEELQEEPARDVNDFVLDSFSSDLHFVVNNDGLGGRNLVKNGFCYLWAGVRATHGVTSGKMCYECKIIKKLDVTLLDSEEPSHAVRIGWSSEKSSLQLGEASLSYGYESSGKICASSNFSAYGETFDEGDVIGAYLDLESEPKSIKYTKNGEDLGVAMSLTVNLDGKSLFPHMFVKNMEIAVNFGSLEEPWFEPLEGYSFVCKGEQLVRTVIPPTAKEECEVLMMVGLPCAGKTVWAQKHVSENKDKKYKVLSQTHILERMKVEGQARKESSTEINNSMNIVVKVLNKMFAMAPTKLRNYVLDQVNVHPSVRKTKLEMFQGFKRKAVVIIPTHDNLRKRTYEKKQRDSGEIPALALADLKCSFELPESGDLLDEVMYPELDGRNALKTVEDYHSDGRYGRDDSQRKRPRYDDRRDYRNRYDDRRRYDDKRSYQQGGQDYRSRQPYRSGPRTGPMYNEPYRRNYDNNSGGYRQYQRDSGYYGGGMKGSRGGSSGFGARGGWNQGGGWGQGGGYYQGGGGGNYYQGGGGGQGYRGGSGGSYNNRGYSSGGYSGSNYSGSGGYSDGYNYRGGYR